MPVQRNTSHQPKASCRKTWVISVAALILFLCGAAALWFQTMFPWMPRRLPEWTIISGLSLSVIALALTAYPLFVRQSERAMETRLICISLVLASLPPCIFLVWLFLQFFVF